MRAGLLRLVGTALLTTCVAVGAWAAPAAAANPQTITFGPLGDKPFGAAPFGISATTNAKGQQATVHTSALNANDCTLSSNPPLTPPTPNTIPVEIETDASPQPHFGDPIALTNTVAKVTVPPDLLLTGYNVGVIANGQVINATAALTIAGSNTVEATHGFAPVNASVTLHFHDPDGTPGTGDETADPLVISVGFPDTQWTPLDAATPVNFTEQSGLATLVFSIFGSNIVVSDTCTTTNPNPFAALDASTAGSGPLTVSFTSLTPTVCGVAGVTVSVLAAGVCTIEATQAGNAEWDPATPVDQSFTVFYGVAKMTPRAHSSFTPGKKIAVKFQLNGANGPIPNSVAQSLGCDLIVTFNGDDTVCATYDPATKYFRASVKTPAKPKTHTMYFVGVAALVGPDLVAYLTVPVSPAVVAQHTPRSGYWMLGADGKVYAFGNAPKLGSAPGPSVAIATRRDGGGYWTVDAAGNVSHFGTAGAYGGHPALRAGERVSTISATPTGKGYWLFTNRGRAFAFGDAHFYGDMAAVALNGPIVASVATPTGHGYFMVGSDGGVFSFGDARFHGSTGNLHLNRPVVGIAPTPDNHGYWLVGSDGGVFAFDAPFRGSMGATHLNQSVNGLVAYGNGYLMVASDGGVFTFSNKPFAGSLAANPPSAPVIGIAAFST